MSDQIRKTWAEILEGGIRAVWSTMDDDQKAGWAKYAKSYLGKTTADGVKLTWGRFGRVVATTGDALESHYRRSQGQKPSASTATPVEVRRAKSDLARPGVMEKVLEDPKIRREVLTKATRIEAGTDVILKPDVPMDPWGKALRIMARMENEVADLAEAIDATRMLAHRQEELDERVDTLIDDLRQIRTPQGRASLRVVGGAS